MAAADWEIDLTQEGTSLATEGPDDRSIQRKFTAHYRVKTDSATTSPKDVERELRSRGLAWIGRSWRWQFGNSTEVDSICKKLDVSYEPKSSGIFNVTATFEPRDSEKKDEEPTNEGKQSTDPLQWRESIDISYTQSIVECQQAEFKGFSGGEFGNDNIAGTPFLQIGRLYKPQGSNLEPYSPGVPYENQITVIRMVKNFAAFDQGEYARWQGTVNSDEMVINKPQLGFRFTASPTTARIKQIAGSTEFENGIGFWRRDIEVWVNPEGWRERLLDDGVSVRDKNPTTEQFISPGELKWYQSEQRNIQDKAGYHNTVPKKLNSKGQLLRMGEFDTYANWRIYEEVPFAGFNW